MPLTVEAVYEDGVLKPASPLPLAQRQKVVLTVDPNLGLALGPLEPPQTLEVRFKELVHQLLLKVSTSCEDCNRLGAPSERTTARPTPTPVRRSRSCVELCADPSGILTNCQHQTRLTRTAPGQRRGRQLIPSACRNS